MHKLVFLKNFSIFTEVLISEHIYLLGPKSSKTTEIYIHINSRNFDGSLVHSIFGSTDSEPDNRYCLLGTGFFRTPRSDNSDSLKNIWIENHPEAIVIPVSSFGPVETKKPDSKMIYCWIIDQNDTLNNYLIKNGCFPGGTMMRAKESKNIVHTKEYESFIEQIKSAEIYARNNKLGIWNKED